MKQYDGCRFDDLVEVTVDGTPLKPRGDLIGRDGDLPTFEWGYQGSGPEHLAIAILADHFGDDQKAQEFGRAFRDEVLATIYGERWSFTSSEIDRFIAQISDDQAKRKDLNSDHGIVHVDMTLTELMNKVRGLK